MCSGLDVSWGPETPLRCLGFSPASTHDPDLLLLRALGGSRQSPQLCSSTAPAITDIWRAI